MASTICFLNALFVYSVAAPSCFAAIEASISALDKNLVDWVAFCIAPIIPPFIKPLPKAPTNCASFASCPVKLKNKPSSIVPTGITIPVIAAAIAINCFLPSERELNFSKILVKN